jgi:hypothetical protein
MIESIFKFDSYGPCHTEECSQQKASFLDLTLLFVFALARFARHLKALYAELGVRGAIAFIRQSCAAPWLDPEQVHSLLSQPFQLQLE